MCVDRSNAAVGLPAVRKRSCWVRVRWPEMIEMGKGRRTAIATIRKAKRGLIFQRREISQAVSDRCVLMSWGRLTQTLAGMCFVTPARIECSE